MATARGRRAWVVVDEQGEMVAVARTRALVCLEVYGGARTGLTPRDRRRGWKCKKALVRWWHP